MSKLLTTVAVSALLVSSGVANATPRGQAQLQGQAQAAKATAVQVNDQAASSTSGAAATGGSDNTDVDAWGFSYSDAPTTVPQAVVSDGVVVTSQGYQVLGPLFHGTWQDLVSTPSGVYQTFSNVLIARGAAYPAGPGKVAIIDTGDDSFTAYEVPFAMKTALCAKDKATAAQLLLSCVE